SDKAASDKAASGKASSKSATREAVAGKAATPWGVATVVEEAKVAQRAGDKRFASIVQLLENVRGEPLIRIAYTTDGVARRGPVPRRPRDVERRRATLAPDSALRNVLGWSGGEA